LSGLSTELRNVLEGRPSPLELDEVAVEIARIHRPETDLHAVQSTLDSWAEAIAAALPPAAGGMQYLSIAHRYLFGTVGLRGDRESYFAPDNSCLDLVISRRRGLPITLSVIYIEVARRLLRPVYGAALPGHFLCRYNDGLVNVLVDVFHEGKLLMPAEAAAMVSAATGEQLGEDAPEFGPASPQLIAVRMLRNLRNAYIHQRDAQRLAALDALVANQS
jgi:regulator of sirC expression with transglutaminase-like and TPR domain